jgi:hypothetical protein
MLITIITILFFAGGSSSMGLLYDFGDTKKLVKTYVVDDERKDAALDVVKEFKARGKAENKSIKALSKQVKNSLADNEGVDAQVEYLGEEFLDNTRVYYKDLLDLRFKLREQFTREEWAAAYAE